MSGPPPTSPSPEDHRGEVLPPPPASRGVSERYRELLPRGSRRPWVGVALFAVAVSALEAVGAVLVYALLGLASDPAGGVELPVVGDVRGWLPTAATTDLITVAAIAVAAFFVLRGAAVVTQTYVSARVAATTSVRLSTRLLDHYLRLPYTFHLRRNSSELIRNANESVTAILEAILMPAVRIAAQGSMVLGLTAVLLATAPWATVMAGLVLGPTTYLTMRYVRARVLEYGRISQQERARGLALLQQSLHGYRDVTVLGRQEHFVDDFRRSRQAIARTRYLRALFGNLPRVTVELVTVAMVTVFIGVTTLAAGADADSLAVVGLFAYAALRIMPALNEITVNLNDIRYGRAALDAIQADLQEPLPPEPATEGPLPFRRELHVRRATFWHPGATEPTLRDVHLTLPRGSSLGIVGATGAGKSTLVDLLVGFLTPQEGEITVDDVPLRGHERAWRRNIGMVSQQVFLLDGTVRENIAFGVDPHDVAEERVLAAVRLAQLEDFIAKLPNGLDTQVGERGTRVSGGQRQRIAIARALYPQPEVLIFDEGTSALDNITERHFTNALRRLQVDHTIITIAHRLTTVRDHDRIVVLDRGRIVGLGSYDTLLADNPTFQRLVRGTVTDGG